MEFQMKCRECQGILIWRGQYLSNWRYPPGEITGPPWAATIYGVWQCETCHEEQRLSMGEVDLDQEDPDELADDSSFD